MYKSYVAIPSACTEFGFYQTCEDNSHCPYARGYHSVNLDLEICEKGFGIKANRVYAGIESTLKYYGGWDLVPGREVNSEKEIELLRDESRALEGHKRLLFVNGDADPWSELSVVNDKRVQTIKVPGASHHFWTHSVKETDGHHVIEARKAIYRHVYDWLGIEGSQHKDESKIE